MREKLYETMKHPFNWNSTTFIRTFLEPLVIDILPVSRLFSFITCMPDIFLISNMSYSTEALPFWNGAYWFVTFCFKMIIFIMIDGKTKVYQSNHGIQYCFWSTFFPVFSSETTPSPLTTHSFIKIIYKTQEVFCKFWFISTIISIRNRTLSK